MLQWPIIYTSNVARIIILLIKTTAARNGVALSYRKVRELYFLAAVFVRRIHEGIQIYDFYNADGELHIMTFDSWISE